MKIESLTIDKLPDGRDLVVSYRRLGEEAFLIQESILIFYFESALGKEPGVCYVSTSNNGNKDIHKILKALQSLLPKT
jgi:hypothetical protein